ncbi:MAG: cytidine deaminase [Desulfurobacteriaceae bacterium]
MKTVEMVKVAKEVLRNAYAPYSKFRVSAVLFGEDGLFTGVNVENASYGLTVCAERVAVFKAVSEGKRKFEKILVYTPGRENLPYPCGACRQVMTEFFGEDFRVIVANDSEEEQFTLGELLPFNFKL